MVSWQVMRVFCTKPYNSFWLFFLYSVLVLISRIVRVAKPSWHIIVSRHNLGMLLGSTIHNTGCSMEGYRAKCLSWGYGWSTTTKGTTKSTVWFSRLTPSDAHWEWDVSGAEPQINWSSMDITDSCFIRRGADRLCLSNCFTCSIMATI